MDILKTVPVNNMILNEFSRNEVIKLSSEIEMNSVVVMIGQEEGRSDMLENHASFAVTSVQYIQRERYNPSSR